MNCDEIGQRIHDIITGKAQEEGIYGHLGEHYVVASDISAYDSRQHASL